jgi:hypothetical protein
MLFYNRDQSTEKENENFESFSYSFINMVIMTTYQDTNDELKKQIEALIDEIKRTDKIRTYRYKINQFFNA